MTSPRGQRRRRRTACEECRTKKLRCTGEHPMCSRCARTSTVCIYSLQKVMGRPKKGRRASEHNYNGLNDLDDLNDLNDLNDHSTSHGESSMLMSQVVTSLPEDLSPLNPNGPDDLLAPGTWGTGQSSLEASEQDRLGVLGQSTHPHTTLPSDVALWETSMSSLSSLPIDTTLQPCACLSAIYLTLDNLRGMHDFSFPYSLRVLQEAVATGWSVFRCEFCPRLFLTATQNVQLLGLLLVSLTERYSKILSGIDSEEKRSTNAMETKRFRVGDMTPANSHLHGGEIDCPASFMIELQPTEWSGMARKVVKAHITSEESARPGINMLIRSLEERQHKWHSESRTQEDAPGYLKTKRSEGPPLCLALAIEAKRAISWMKFDQSQH